MQTVVDPLTEKTATGVSAAEALTLRCIELLQAGDVKTFNEIRPQGQIDLSGIDLSGRKLEGVNFDDAILTRANLERCYMPNASLQRVKAEFVCFDDATIDGSVFGGNTSLKHGSFKRALARNVDFQFTDLTSSEMADAQCQDSNFSNSFMIDTKLARTNFTGAIAINSWFLGANLQATIFHKANLRQANFIQSRGNDIDFSASNLCQAKFVCALYHGDQLNFKGAYTKDWVADDFGFSLYTAMEPKPNEDDDETGVRQITPAERLKKLLKHTKNEEPAAGLFNDKIKKTDEASLVHGVPGSNIQLYREGLADLDALVGLKKVKEIVHELADFLMVNAWRRQEGLPPLPCGLHFVFKGNPGTGKTSVALVLGKIFAGVGYLPSPEVLNKDRSDLVGGVVGESEIKTSKVCEEAMGKILLIDEAYELARKGDSGVDYGPKAVTTLLKRMSDNRGKFVVIAAGYPELMEDFVKSNPGLRRRFTEYILFDDYSASELTEIGKRMFSKVKSDLSGEFLAGLNAVLYLRKQKMGWEFGNAGDMQNLFEKSLRVQSTRLTAINRKDKEALTQPTVADLAVEYFLEIKPDKIPWKELRWRTKDGTEISMEQYPNKADDELNYPELTEESKKLLDTIIPPRPSKEEEEFMENFKNVGNG